MNKIKKTAIEKKAEPKKAIVKKKTQTNKGLKEKNSRKKKLVTKKSLPKKNVSLNQAVPNNDDNTITILHFQKWRSVCTDCNEFKTPRIFDTEDEAVEFGVESHGEVTGHVIEAES